MAGYPLSVLATRWSWQLSFQLALLVSGSCVLVAGLARGLLGRQEMSLEDKVSQESELKDKEKAS